MTQSCVRVALYVRRTKAKRLRSILNVRNRDIIESPNKCLEPLVCLLCWLLVLCWSCVGPVLLRRLGEIPFLVFVVLFDRAPSLAAGGHGPSRGSAVESQCCALCEFLCFAYSGIAVNATRHSTPVHIRRLSKSQRPFCKNGRPFHMQWQHLDHRPLISIERENEPEIEIDVSASFLAHLRFVCVVVVLRIQSIRATSDTQLAW